MSVILRNDYGAIAVNKGVIESMIVEDLLSLGDDIILCSKKGKPVGKNPGRFMDPDYFDAVDIYEKKKASSIKCSRPSSKICFYQTARLTLPDLRQLVHTDAFLTLPLSLILTVWMLAFHFLLVWILE